jgi:hypothetical protein
MAIASERAMPSGQSARAPHASGRRSLRLCRIGAQRRLREDPHAWMFTFNGERVMTTEKGMPITARRNQEDFRPTPAQYFIGACWGVLLVLCVCAEGLKTVLG